MFYGDPFIVVLISHLAQLRHWQPVA